MMNGMMNQMETTDASIPASPDRPHPGDRLRSIRVRLLVWFVLLLALASSTSVLAVRQILLNRLDERIDRDLVQESKELRALAEGIDPETGEPFNDDVRSIFRVYLERNIPSRNEALVTFVDGEPFLRSRRVVPYRLDKDEALVERWGTITSPDRGTADTPAGTIEYLAVPLRGDGDTKGVFVVSIFSDRERTETDTAIQGAAAEGLVVLLIGSLLAWRLADRILTPVRKVREAAESISQSDLTSRIEIEGRDEVSELAATFNRMLDRIEEAFGAQKQFIDDASHELRTPITIIRGHLETIESDPDDRARTIALVLDELERMARLVDNLLLLARSERPDLLALSVVDVATLTSDVHAKASALAPREWILEEEGRGTIVADPQRMTQALIQLAQNASQHTVDGSEIAIGSRVLDGHTTFWVRDTGSGIPPQEQARIFERFAQGSTSSKRAEGTGLGLAIVQAIANAHLGRVEVESKVGEGSTFRIVIPIDRHEEAPPAVIER